MKPRRNETKRNPVGTKTKHLLLRHPNFVSILSSNPCENPPKQEVFLSACIRRLNASYFALE